MVASLDQFDRNAPPFWPIKFKPVYSVGMVKPIRTEDDKLTSAQAARLLGVERRAVIRMVEHGALRAIQAYPGAHRRFDRAEVEALAGGQS